MKPRTQERPSRRLRAARASRRPHPAASPIEDLVAANRILAQHGVLDAYGHVSVRNPANPAHFLISRSLAPELVTWNDVMELDLDCKPIAPDPRLAYLERFIHGEIYKARPDVMAIVHSHSPSVIPFAASSIKLRPIYHMSAFLRGDAPVFDIRKHFGCTDMLVRTPQQGAALAAELGGGNVSLMRGHGFVAVGDTLAIAVYRAIYTELNASLQQKAITLGGTVTYLDADEAAMAEATTRGTIARPWELWKRKLRVPDSD